MRKTILSTHLIYLTSASAFWSSIVWILNDNYGESIASIILSLVQFLPILFMVPFVFIIIDRYQKHSILVAINIFRFTMCTTSGFIYLSGHSDIFLFIITLVLIRGLDAIYNPAIRAGIGGIKYEDGRRSSQYYLQLITIISSILSPFFIPLLTSRSLATLLLFLGLVYGLSSFIFLFSKNRFQVLQVTQRSFRDWKELIREGWSALKAIPVIRPIIITLPFIDFSLTATTILLPAVSKSQEIFDSNYYFTALVFLTGFSRFIGTYLGKRYIRGRHDGKLLAYNCILQGVGYCVAFFLVGNLFFVLPILFIGVLAGAASLSVNEIIQDTAPDDTKGRVFTIIGFIVFLVMPLGPLVAGFVSAINFKLIFLLAGLLLIVIGIPAARKRKILSFVSSKKQ